MKLFEIADIFAGQNAPQGKKSYCSKGIPFIKAGNLIELLSNVSEKDIQQINLEIAKQYKLKLFPAGVILFAKSGMSCLKGYVYLTKSPCYVVNHLAVIIPKKCNNQYLKYYFEYNKPNQLIKDISYPSISLKDISNIEINLPSKEKQEYIATILNKIVVLIDLQKQRLKKLDLLVKSRFLFLQKFKSEVLV